MDEPEYVSVEAFVEYLFADDQTEFDLSDVVRLADRTHTSNYKLIYELKSYGLTMKTREVLKKVRGFLTSSHDRYYGPGCSKTHGGSGWEQITGIAGQEG